MNTHDKNLLLNAVKMMQRQGDNYLYELYRAFHRTKDRFLFWNLFVWFPILNFLSFFNVLKWTKKFPVVQGALIAFGGTIFGIKVSEIKGYEKVVEFLKAINLDSVDWGWIVVVYLIVWYLVTLLSIQKQITNPTSKYFLFKAFRKWDASYKVFGALVESPEYEKLFEDILSKLNESTIIQVDASEIETLIQKYEEQKDRLKHELSGKRELVNALIEMNKKLSEVIVEHDSVHYKHLDMLNIPYIVYKKQRRSLVREWSEGFLQYEKSIALKKSDNYFVKVRNAKGEAVTQDDLVGFMVKVGNSDYVVAFKVDKNNPLIEQHDIMNKEEFQMTIKAVLSRI